MRDVTDQRLGSTSLKGMAEIANHYAQSGMDSRAGIGVGAALLIDVAPEWTYKGLVYAGFNISISGMEYKLHAEQMAIYQALTDLELLTPHIEFSGIYKHKEPEGGDEYEMNNTDDDFMDNVSPQVMVVVTDKQDLSLRCGHCLQVMHAFCKHTNSDPSEVKYIAAAKTDDEENIWRYDKNVLTDLLEDTYIGY